MKLKKHYIHDFNRKQLIEFLDFNPNTTLSDGFLLRSCIRQLLSDYDADKYIVKNNILYVIETS